MMAERETHDTNTHTKIHFPLIMSLAFFFSWCVIQYLYRINTTVKLYLIVVVVIRAPPHHKRFQYHRAHVNQSINICLFLAENISELSGSCVCVSYLI